MSARYINAGAGSGKTYTLTHMLSDMLVRKENPIDASRIILTTFTKAAAGEFLRKAREVLIADGKPDKAAELDSATIGTVHSVCEKFVKRYWYRLGLTLPLNIISQEDKRYYVSLTTEAVANDEDVRFFADVAQKLEMDADFWKDYLKELIDRKNDFGIGDLSRSCQLSCDNLAKVFSTPANPDAEKELDGFISRLVSLIDAQNTDREAAGKAPQYQSERKEAVSLQHGASLLKKAIAVRVWTGKGLTAVRAGLWKDSFPLSEYQRIDDIAKAALLSTDFGDSLQGCVKRLFALAAEWEKRYRVFKDANGLLDFSDLEQKFLRILYDDGFEDAREDIKSSFDVMMVDEFQDSNPVQVKIFRKLMELVPETVFVGDQKQAIYGFRGTESSLVEDFVKEIPAQDSLKKSYRSIPALVNAANRIFCKAFGVKQLPVILDDPEAPYDGVSLFPNRTEKDGKCPSLMHWMVPRVSTRSEKKQYTAVGERIKELIRSGAFSYRDIAVLLRNKTDIPNVVSAFRNVGLPVSVQEKGFVQWAEVQLILSLLRYYVDAGDCGAKADVLHLVRGLSTETVIKDRLNAGPDPTWRNGEDVFRLLDGIRERTSALSVSEIVDAIILELGMYENVQAWGLADARARNIGLVADLARKYEQQCENVNAAPTVYGYINYVLGYKLDSSPADTTDTVKVLTHHASKGLEWPVVIMDELDSLDVSEQEMWRKDIGGVVPCREGEGVQLYVFPRLLYKKAPEGVGFVAESNLPDPLMSAVMRLPIFDAARKRKIDEERRLLYVGFTRAKDCLVTLGTDKSTYSWLSLCGAGGGTAVSGGEISLWDPEYPSVLEVLPEPVLAETEGTEAPSWVLPSPDVPAVPEKYISPSKIGSGQSNVAVPKLKDVFRGNPMTQKIKASDNAQCGTAIHNIFAAYDPSAKTEVMEEMAARIINGSRLAEELPSPSSVIASARQFHDYMEKTYGAGVQLRELPVMLQRQDGTVIRGEMDLVWQLPDGRCVLVDYKSYHGIEDFDHPKAYDEYYGYAPQLKAYRDALLAVGLEVVDTLVYYLVQGRVIRFGW